MSEAPPLVDRDQPLLDGYVIRLPYPMARRVEDGALVFWHSPKRLTFWINVSERDEAGDPLSDWRRVQSPGATDESSSVPAPWSATAIALTRKATTDGSPPSRDSSRKSEPSS